MPLLATEHPDIPTKDILSWIFDDLEYDENKPIYISTASPSRSVSASRARTLIRQLIAGFQAHWTLQPKDVVNIHAFNDPLYSILFLSIIGAGGIFTGSNPAYTSYELAHHFRASETKFIITEPEGLDAVAQAAKEVGNPRDRILVFNPLEQTIPSSGGGWTSWTTLLTHGERDWLRFSDLNTCKTTEAARLFSSGTTGLPKPCMNTHYNLIAQHTLVVAHNNRIEKDYDIVKLLTFPMFHAAQVPVAHTSTLKLGHTAYVMRRFEMEAFLDAVERFGVTDLALAPPIVVGALGSGLVKNRSSGGAGHGDHRKEERRKYSLGKVRSVQCGAAPLDKGPQNAFEKFVGEGTPFTQVWGMTEGNCVVSMLQWPEKDESGSVGRPLPGLDMKIIDDSNNDITAPNTPGEICIRGPTVIPGYLNNPTANSTSFDPDGYFHTGDIGYYTPPPSNLWYIIDRKKEMIKVRSFQVAPAEIEGTLLQHPDIVDAAVIGVPAPAAMGGGRGEEVPLAFVVRKGERLTEEDVKKWCEGRLARFKRLDGGVRFVDHGGIPRNASGKVLKRVLRERVENERKGERAKL